MAIRPLEPAPLLALILLRAGSMELKVTLYIAGSWAAKVYHHRLYAQQAA